MDNVELLIKGGEVWTPAEFVDADVAVSGGKIAALGAGPGCGRESLVLYDIAHLGGVGPGGG